MTYCCQTASGQQINRLDDVHLSMTLYIYYLQNSMQYKIHLAKTNFFVKCFRDKYVAYKYNFWGREGGEMSPPPKQCQTFFVTGFLFNVRYILIIFYFFVEAPYILGCLNK